MGATDSYKLQIKLGDAEFSAEGPEASVKQAYADFLKAVELGSKARAAATATVHPSSAGEDAGKGRQVTPELLERVFLREGDVLSLRHMPPGDSTNKAADAAILLMYGFKRLLSVSDVGVIKLNKGLLKTGFTPQRTDRLLEGHARYFMKGGARSGAYYTLNNMGERQAEQWISTWFS